MSVSNVSSSSAYLAYLLQQQSLGNTTAGASSTPDGSASSPAFTIDFDSGEGADDGTYGLPAAGSGATLSGDNAASALDSLLSALQSGGTTEPQTANASSGQGAAAPSAPAHAHGAGHHHHGMHAETATDPTDPSTTDDSTTLLGDLTDLLDAASSGAAQTPAPSTGSSHDGPTSDSANPADLPAQQAMQSLTNDNTAAAAQQRVVLG